MGAARGYFERGPQPFADDAGPPPGIFGGDGPPPGIFGGGGPPPGMPPGVGGGGVAIRGGRLAPPPQAAAAAAQARAAAAAAAAMEGDYVLVPGASGSVVDPVTGETRPSDAQGRVERLDGGDEGDLWRGMQGMGIGGGGYQAQGRGAYPYGTRGPASNPYYEQMFRSRGPLGAMRQRGPGGGGASAQQSAGYGGASNAATLGAMGGAADALGGGGGGDGGHPGMRGMGPMGGAGGSTAERLLVQARMQQQMAMQAMGQGAMSEPRPQAGGPREWNHFFQGR
jgi:hypothetical protein